MARPGACGRCIRFAHSYSSHTEPAAKPSATVSSTTEPACIRKKAATALATASGHSFPSGHALGSTVTYGVLLLIFLPALPHRWRPMLLLVMVIVGESILFLVTAALAAAAVAAARVYHGVPSISRLNQAGRADPLPGPAHLWVRAHPAGSRATRGGLIGWCGGTRLAPRCRTA